MDKGIILKKITGGQLQTNCYILACAKTKKCVIIDPGVDAKEIEREINKLRFTVSAIILTHGHFDHIAALDDLNYPVYIHKDDLFLLVGKKILKPYLNSKEIHSGRLNFVSDGSKIHFGNLTIEVLHTPGHSPGSICLKIGAVLFSGDTLFYSGVGRTDNTGGSYVRLIASLRHKLMLLPDDTHVLPGHGPETSIGNEKETGGYFAD